MMKHERLLKIILSPHISEKTNTGADKRGEYAFHVSNDATKPEIRDAIKHVFSVEVKSVRIVNVKKKKRMFRGYEGCKKGWKKAYVTLQAGQKIEPLAAQ